MPTPTAPRPVLPYASGCKHASPCANVYAGRACALDATKANGYDAEGRATVTYLEPDEVQGVAADSVVYALDPYTGRLSGRRYGDPAPVAALEVARKLSGPSAATVIMFGRPGLAGRGVPGLFATYSRKGVTV